MVSQLSVVKGAGELGGVRDYGGNGSIQQSISNEGKNWSKSSRWKSCSAWGGLSTLPVSRAAVLLVPLCQTVPQLGNGCYHTMILKYLHLLHFLHSVGFFFLTLCWYSPIPFSRHILCITMGRFRGAWRIMAACPSPLPSFNHPQLPAIRQLILHLTHSPSPPAQLCTTMH